MITQNINYFSFFLVRKKNIFIFVIGLNLFIYILFII